MKLILAVSGGVDSMVLVDIFKNKPGVFVAHFNHKLRPSADDDEEFVRNYCEKNSLRFEVGYLDIKPGEKVSEEKARAARYDFLFGLKARVEKMSGDSAMILTAHHLDDLVETVAINILRGTSWRGLAPFSNNIYRPFIQSGDVLLPESKADILTYASRNKISYRQDPTNYEPDYLRNRVREIFSTMEPDEHYNLNQKIFALYKKQDSIRHEIYDVISEMIDVKKFLDDGVILRKWFYDLDDIVGAEILRFLIELKGLSLTGPKLLEFLHAIQTYQPEKKFNLPEDRLVVIHKNWLKI